MTEKQPIFQSVFAPHWEQMPTVFHKHYANRPFTRDVTVVEGKMNIETSWLIKLLSPILGVTGGLPPFSGDNIPVTVTFRSEQDSKAFWFDREFHFPDRKPYYFRSKLLPVGERDMIEWMPLGIGWHATYSFRNDEVKLEHRGYVFRLFSKSIKLPLEWMIGRGEAQEMAIDLNSFRMAMTINHMIFGKVYGYNGTFTVREVRLDG